MMEMFSAHLGRSLIAFGSTIVLVIFFGIILRIIMKKIKNVEEDLQRDESIVGKHTAGKVLKTWFFTVLLTGLASLVPFVRWLPLLFFLFLYPINIVAHLAKLAELLEEQKMRNTFESILPGRKKKREAIIDADYSDVKFKISEE